jgi:hypothetical protein
MFREFEIVVWTSFCEAETIAKVLQKCGSDPQVQNKIVLAHLVNTAFYTKRILLDDTAFIEY